MLFPRAHGAGLMRWLFLFILMLSIRAYSDAIDLKYQRMVQDFKTPYVRENGEVISKVEYRGRTLSYTTDVNRERMAQEFKSSPLKGQMKRLGAERIVEIWLVLFNIEGHKLWCANPDRYEGIRGRSKN